MFSKYRKYTDMCMIKVYHLLWNLSSGQLLYFLARNFHVIHLHLIHPNLVHLHLIHPNLVHLHLIYHYLNHLHLILTDVNWWNRYSECESANAVILNNSCLEEKLALLQLLPPVCHWLRVLYCEWLNMLLTLYWHMTSLLVMCALVLSCSGIWSCDLMM